MVSLAGFIGYFGKYLSKIIISKFRKQEPERKTIIHKYESPEKYGAKVDKKKSKLDYTVSPTFTPISQKHPTIVRC
jgi:hypothetical protein